MRRAVNFLICIAVFGMLFAALHPHNASAAEPFVYQTWTIFTTRDGLPDNRIRDVKVADGRVWVATDGGLARLVDSEWKTWTKANGLPYPTITSIAVDPRTQDVWLGSLGGGLVRLSAGRFDRFDQFNSGIAGDLVFSVAVVGDRVWTATNAGISVYDARNDSWGLHLARRADAPEIAVTKLFPAGPYLYAQSWCDPLRRLDLRDQTPTFAEFPGNGLSDNAAQPVLSFAFAGKTVYSATRTQVFRRRPRDLVEMRSITPGREGGAFVYCMAARGEDEIWIGTEAGLIAMNNWSKDTSIIYTGRRAGRASSVTMYRGSKLVGALDRMATIPDSRIRCITLDGDDIWVGTVNGLARGTDRRRWDDAQAVAARESAESTGTGHDLTNTEAPPISNRPSKRTRDSVTIGCLVPVARTVTLPSAETRQGKAKSSPNLFAVQIAIQQANDRGGYRDGIPFKVAVRTAGYPAYAWGTLEDDFPLLKNEYDATAMLTALNSGDRIAKATALAMEMPIVNATVEAVGADEHVHPWISRCPRTDPSYHAAILDYLVDVLGATRIGIVRTGYGEERVHLDFWRRHAKSMGYEIHVDVAWDPSGTGEGLATLEAADVDAVLTWSDARTSMLLRGAMHQRGSTPWFVGSDWMVSDATLASVRFASDRVIAANPCSHERNRARHDRFEERFLSQNTSARRKGKLPSNAYLSFDAAEHLIHAIVSAGLDPYAIQKILHAMGRPAVARLVDGKWHRVALRVR